MENDHSARTMGTIAQLKIQFPNLELHEGLPVMSQLNLIGRKMHSLLIMDDLANKVFSSYEMVELFRNSSSHEVRAAEALVGIY